jgi:hypothetical protein
MTRTTEAWDNEFRGGLENSRLGHGVKWNAATMCRVARNRAFSASSFPEAMGVLFATL